MAGYRHVVVGTDGSESAGLAVVHAAQLAGALGAKLTVVMAYAGDGDAADVAVVAVGAARTLAMAEGAIDVDVFVEPGDPADVVIGAAESRGGDVIVVGSKGMTTAKRFLLGNVPNKISHHAPCDVIIVRTAP
jgi:nucleotide-binding universal stress UspA family protein